MKILIGNILQSKAQTFVNTVNCVGVMGKGIALEFKKRFPQMFEDYLNRCNRGEIKPGMPYIYKTLVPPQIINFPTKDHWKSVSKITDIEKGLDYLVSHYKEWGITSLAVPPLGCGNGQLEWKSVGPLIYKKLKNIDIPVEIFAPYGTNPRELTFEFLEEGFRTSKGQAAPSLRLPVKPAWAALVEILYRIENQPYHWPAGRIIFQKIAFVATQEGLPTGLNYRAGSFGPFSGDLKIAMSQLINNNLLQEERLGRMFMVKVGPNYQTVRKNFLDFFEKWSAVIEKTTDLFLRMNTREAEIVTTVMFAAESLKKETNITPSEIEVLNFVMNWKEKHRPPLDKQEVASTIRNLGLLHWLNVKPDNKLPLPKEEIALL